jgi:hypothetical protein
MATIAKNRPKEMDGGYDLKGSFRLVVPTGLVTGASASTAAAGHLFAFRWASSTVHCMIKRVAARGVLTTAYGTAQETGLNMVLTRTYTAAHTGGTSVEIGSTTADTNSILSSLGTSIIAVNQIKVATTGDLTDGTHVPDVNSIGHITGWSGTIGDTIPMVTAGNQGLHADLFNAETSLHKSPIILKADEGFILRNQILMGATGVVRWSFLVEWDEGVLHA